jgi:hypothetical protein
VHGHVALLVGQPRHRLHHLLAQGRRDAHRVGEPQRPTVSQQELARRHLRHRRAGQGLDAFLPEEHAEQPLAAGQPADVEVAQERLGGWRSVLPETRAFVKQPAQRRSVLAVTATPYPALKPSPWP